MSINGIGTKSRGEFLSSNQDTNCTSAVSSCTCDRLLGKQTFPRSISG